MAVARTEGERVGALRRPGGRASAKRNRSAIVDALADLGYEPAPEDAARLRLRNCPFRTVAEVAPDLVCGMNCELVAGLMEGLGMDPARVTLDPAPPSCCLTVAVPQ